jgi:excisionase family DNA binding protein
VKFHKPIINHLSVIASLIMRNLETIDIGGAADLLKIHRDSVLELIDAGALPAARIGRVYVLMSKDVLDYIREQIDHQTAARLLAARGQNRLDSKRAVFLIDEADQKVSAALTDASAAPFRKM